MTELSVTPAGRYDRGADLVGPGGCDRRAVIWGLWF